jgi:hypothetical protein
MVEDRGDARASGAGGRAGRACVLLLLLRRSEKPRAQPAGRPLIAGGQPRLHQPRFQRPERARSSQPPAQHLARLPTPPSPPPSPPTARSCADRAPATNPHSATLARALTGAACTFSARAFRIAADAAAAYENSLGTIAMHTLSPPQQRTMLQLDSRLSRRSMRPLAAVPNGLGRPSRPAFRWPSTGSRPSQLPWQQLSQRACSSRTAAAAAVGGWPAACRRRSLACVGSAFQPAQGAACQPGRPTPRPPLPRPCLQQQTRRRGKGQSYPRTSTPPPARRSSTSGAPPALAAAGCWRGRRCWRRHQHWLAGWLVAGWLAG